MRWVTNIRTWSRRRGQRDERGATLVEAAFVMPVFVLVIFGIFEFAGTTMATTSAGAAVKSGARMATVGGSNSMTDRDILRRMQHEGAGMSQDTVVKIIVWNAREVGEDPPAACQSGSINRQRASDGFVTNYGSCNTYFAPQSQAFVKANLPDMEEGDTYGPAYSEYYFGCTGPTDPESIHKLDCAWPTGSRRALEPSPQLSCPGSYPTRPQAASTPAYESCLTTDLVGIYVETTHKNYTGFFGDQVTITEKTTAKIEPQGYDK